MTNARAPVRSFALPLTPANAWSSEEVQLLRQLAIGGASLELMASRLRRTRSAIRNKATMHGISLKQRGGLFLSLVLCLLLTPAMQPAQAAQAQVNACTLLTSAEISQVISRPVDGGRRQDDGLQADGQYSSSCIWMIEPGKPLDQAAPMGGRRFVILNVQQWPPGKQLAGKFLQAFRDSAEQGVIASKPSPRKFGDEALWWGDGLAVRSGDMSFGVSVFMPSANQPRTSALEEKLAPMILRRLGAQPAI